MYKYPYAILLIMLGIFIAGFSIPSQADGVHRAPAPSLANISLCYGEFAIRYRQRRR